MKTKPKSEEAKSNGLSSNGGGTKSVDEMVAKFTKVKEELPVDKYFRALVKLEGSDLHMKVGKPPIIRVHGTLKPLNRDPITSEEMTRLLAPMLSERDQGIFDREGVLTFAYTVDVDGTQWRFRVNMLQQLGRMGLVARRVNNFIPNFEGLHLPGVMESLCHFEQG